MAKFIFAAVVVLFAVFYETNMVTALHRYINQPPDSPKLNHARRTMPSKPTTTTMAPPKPGDVLSFYWEYEQYWKNDSVQEHMRKMIFPKKVRKVYVTTTTPPPDIDEPEPSANWFMKGLWHVTGFIGLRPNPSTIQTWRTSTEIYYPIYEKSE